MHMRRPCTQARAANDFQPCTLCSYAFRHSVALKEAATTARRYSAPPGRLAYLQSTRCSKRRRLCTRANMTGREVIDSGKQKYEEGDRMAALRNFEKAVRQPLSPQERREALYATTVIHASFGDIEQAQMSLRESLEAGLDFEAALNDRAMIPWKSSPQVLAQLKKFARTLQQIRQAVAPSGRSRSEVPARRTDPVDYASSGKDRLPKPNPNMSLSEMLRTDITGMDATVSGIFKRVLLLAIVGLLLGTALFYIGLEFSGIAR